MQNSVQEIQAGLLMPLCHWQALSLLEEPQFIHLQNATVVELVRHHHNEPPCTVMDVRCLALIRGLMHDAYT